LIQERLPTEGVLFFDFSDNQSSTFSLGYSILPSIMEDCTPLTSAEKKELRGIGQRLKPHVSVGKQGLTLTVFNEIETALLKNGLIKIRFDADRTTIQAYCDEIASQRQCESIGGVGKTRIFFRDMPEEEPV
jgi:RNA-binding protein